MTDSIFEDLKVSNDFLTSMENFLDRHRFLENEVLRCYREMENLDAEIDLLQTQKMDLVEALAKKTWQDMQRSAFKRKQARKWR